MRRPCTRGKERRRPDETAGDARPGADPRREPRRPGDDMACHVVYFPDAPLSIDRLQPPPDAVNL